MDGEGELVLPAPHGQPAGAQGVARDRHQGALRYRGVRHRVHAAVLRRWRELARAG